MADITSEFITIESRSDDSPIVIVRGPGFVSAFDLAKRAFLDDVPDSVRAKADEIALAFVPK